MSRGVAVGIDLGTTNSCVGFVRNGDVKIIANDTGSRTTPSCVAFTDEERLIGASAKAQATWNPQNTVYEVKRLIGRKFDDPNLQEKIKNWPFKVIEDKGNPKIAVNFLNQKKELTPEEISAMILTKMKQVAEDFAGEKVTKAVITIPAYFNDSQRQATLDAGKIAGLEVLRIINEPTAAAIAYGVDRKIKERRNVLVFDLGGGTFDVALLAIENGNFEVLAVSGDTFLGGGDFDNRLVDHFVQEFKRKTGIEIADNKRALGKLREASEKVKCQLSAALQERIQIEELVPGHDFSTAIRRSRFEGLCSDLFENILEPVKTVLEDSNLDKHQVHDIVLAGGSTRIPKIQELLSTFFDNRKLNKTINPDEAVAYGAAVHAALLSGETSVDEITLHDVIPLSLGIYVHGDKMSKIIKKNSKYPVREAENYTTVYDYCTEVQCQVYEGERSQATLNSFLGSFNVEGIERALAGVPKLEVTFEVDENCILHASARDKRTNATNSITITTSKGRLSKQDINRMIDEHKNFLDEEGNFKNMSEATNELEGFCLNMKTTIENKKIKGFVLKKDADRITRACDAVITWIQATPRASKRDFERKRKDLEDIADDI